MAAPVVVGIDPNLTETGVVILNSGTLVMDSLITSEPIEGVSKVQRIKKICDDVRRTIIGAYSNGFKPDLVVIENFAFAAKGQAALDMGHLGYSIRAMFENPKDLYMKYIEPTPQQVKQFASGEGQASKAVMLLAVYKRWGVEYHNDNLADAYSMAQLGTAYLGDGKDLTGFQAKVINTLKKPPKKKTKKGKKND